MKKIISLCLFLLIITMPVSASFLYEYGSFDERAQMAVDYGIVNNISEYIGSYEQNIKLLNALDHAGEANEMVGGASGESELPLLVANFETSLASKITSDATTLTLVSATTDAGNSLSGWYGLTIDVGNSNQEYVIGNCSGVTCSSLIRGISTDNGVSTSTDWQYSHRRGAAVQMTDHPNLVIITNILNGIDGIPDILYYDDSNTFTSAKQLIDKNYADSIANQGAATSSDTVAGIAERATAAEQAANTNYGTDRPLYLGAKYASSTSANNYAIIADSSGELDPSWISDNNYTFSGDNSFTGSTTISDLIYGGTSITSNGAELNKLDGASTTVTSTNLNTLTAGTGSNADDLHKHNPIVMNSRMMAQGWRIINIEGDQRQDIDAAATEVWDGTAVSGGSLKFDYDVLGAVADDEVGDGTALGADWPSYIDEDGNAHDWGNESIIEFQAFQSNGGDSDIFFGLGGNGAADVTSGAVAADATLTDRHAGFFLVDGTTLYASNADNVTQTKTDVTGSYDLDKRHSYRIWVQGGTRIRFYIDNTLVATHTTNLPSSDTHSLIRFGAESQNVAATTNLFIYTPIIFAQKD